MKKKRQQIDTGPAVNPIAKQATMFVLLEDAKAELEAKLDEGAECPCCGQLAKRYERPLYSTMARQLIWFHRNTREGEFIHFSNRTVPRDIWGGDVAKLALWGLLEAEGKDEDPSKRTSGRWRITKKGRQFVRGEITIPRSVFVYNSQVHGWSNEDVTIDVCLGKRFDYRDLMGLPDPEPSEEEEGEEALSC